jgi:hypothetical protein
MKIDWRRSIGRHGPSGVFPSDLQEDLADGGIVSLPESYHATTTAQRRHAPSCGIIVRYQSRLWTGSMRCGVVRTRQYACYIPSHHELGDVGYLHRLQVLASQIDTVAIYRPGQPSIGKPYSLTPQLHVRETSFRSGVTGMLWDAQYSESHEAVSRISVPS